MATILRLKDIAKVWHIERTKEQVVALGGISLEVEQGEFLVFVGPSGCGIIMRTPTFGFQIGRPVVSNIDL